MIPIVAYLRVSGMSQIDGGGFDRQELAIATWVVQQSANGKDYRLEHKYYEKGVSGTTDADLRPAFKEMVEALLSNGCRTILVESLDRVAREFRVQEHLIIYLASKGLSLISANTGEDVTAAMTGDPMRKALVQMQGIFSELDRSLLQRRLEKGRQKLKAETGRCEGQKPFGHYPGEAGTLTIIQDLHRQRQTPTQIARRLNDLAIPARLGGKWHGASIHKILWRKV